ncbi:hypothetical protein BD65_511 [Yersinia ruckeri]|nr:hypothetical protein BD65_511 [Yersinia ruckeri]
MHIEFWGGLLTGLPTGGIRIRNTEFRQLYFWRSPISRSGNMFRKQFFQRVQLNVC